MFLQGLEVTVQCSQLQAGVRQYLHRMIICLGDELLRYVPVAVSLLLKDCKVRMWIHIFLSFELSFLHCVQLRSNVFYIQYQIQYVRRSY